MELQLAPLCVGASFLSLSGLARRSWWPATIIGFSSRPLPKLASSWLMTLKSSTGSGRPEASETSTRWTSSRVRSMWRRNWTPRPGAQVRALDKPGHVGDHKGLLVRLLAHGHHAEVGLEGGERVVGDLGPGGGDARDERGFAGVGVADQAHIGQQLQLQPIDALLAGPAQFVLARRLVGAGGKVLVAASAASALGDDEALVRLLKIVNQFAGLLVVKRCADRDLQHDRVAVESRSSWSPCRARRAAPCAPGYSGNGSACCGAARLTMMTSPPRPPSPPGRDRRGARTSRAGKPCSRCRRRRP